MIAPKCRFCGKHRPAEEFGGPPELAPCFACYERHGAALRMLAGTAVTGCQECLRPVEELQAENEAGDVRMRLYDKDGVLELLCKRCGDEYERKRPELYARTPYGQRRLKIGR
jgi:hypothetical protein